MPALICFIAAAAFLTYFVNQIFTSWIFQSFNVIFSVIWLVSYIVVAFSDPGIAQPNQGNSLASPDEFREYLKYNRECVINAERPRAKGSGTAVTAMSASTATTTTVLGFPSASAEKTRTTSTSS